MLAVPDRGAGRQSRENLLQQILAIDQRRLGQIEALAIEEIEHEVAEPVLPAGFQIGLQVVEASDAAWILDHHLPVEQPGGKADFRDGGRDA